MISEKLQREKETNQRAEQMAILITIMKIPKGDELKIKTDSMYTTKGIVQGSKK